MVAQSFDIFVSVGTHPSPFNRLFEQLDKINKKKKFKIFAQTGTSTYKPKTFISKKYVSPLLYDKLIAKSRIIIAHGGAGIIGSALLYSKPLVIVPRLLKYKEHTNNHQLELAKQLENKKNVFVVYDISNLEKAVSKAFSLSKRKSKKTKPSNIRMKQIIESFIKNNF